MCRIYGTFGSQETDHILEKVSSKQLRGGPDHQRFMNKKNWSLGYNRLAIQDLNGGLQPYNYNNEIYSVFNGEIYNYRELKALLKEKKYTFSDNCDGSIIIPLYLEYGLDFAKYLNGMFAIAIIDMRQSTKLIIATDPTGIKSIYYYYDAYEKVLKFSSELQALLAFGNINQDLRLESVDEYLFGRAIWGKATIYQNIYTLPPSSLLISNLYNPPKIKTYQSRIGNDLLDTNLEDAAFNFNTIFEKEISQMLCADVPVCVITSGGLDSSYITALASRHYKPLHSFNIWYEGDWPGDERHFASEVSQWCNTVHHQIIIPEKRFPELIFKTLNHIGQPNSAPHCISTYALFEAIHDAGFKVAISGDGADEFFAGYARFAIANQDPDDNWISTYLDKMSIVGKIQREELYTDDYRDFLRYKSLLSTQVSTELSLLDKNSNRLEMLLKLDQISRFPYYILRRLDHLSMAHSVEARVPFCQPSIANLARKIPNHFKIDSGQVKNILYKAANDKIPPSILNRPKQPFTLPITAMLRKGHVLFELITDTLKSRSLQNMNIFNMSKISQLLEKQLDTPNDKDADALWSIAMFELWLNVNTKNTFCLPSVAAVILD